MYYSPNTFKELSFSRTCSWLNQNWPTTKPRSEPVTTPQLLLLFPVESIVRMRPSEALYWAVFTTMWVGSIAPMIVVFFLPAGLPLALGMLNAWPFAAAPGEAALRAMVVGIVAEALTNAHSF